MAPATERIFIAQPTPLGPGTLVASPFQFLVSGEDNLRITGWTSVAGLSLVWGGRMVLLDGTIKPFTGRGPLTSSRFSNTYLQSLGTGFLLNFSVVVTGGTIVQGECYARVTLVRGLTGAVEYLGTVAQGYVTNSQAISFPGSPLQLSTEGAGVLRQFSGTNPAAGVDPDEVVPAGARWELVSFFDLLVCSAVAVTRRPLLRLETAGGGILAESRAPGSVGSNGSGGFSWMQGMPWETTLAGLTGGSAGLPSNPMLLAGNHIVIVTLGLDAGDNWQAPDLAVKEWLEANA